MYKNTCSANNGYYFFKKKGTTLLIKLMSISNQRDTNQLGLLNQIDA